MPASASRARKPRAGAAHSHPSRPRLARTPFCKKKRSAHKQARGHVRNPTECGTRVHTLPSVGNPMKCVYSGPRNSWTALTVSSQATKRPSVISAIGITVTSKPALVRNPAMRRAPAGFIEWIRTGTSGCT
jgi:hypothetical protein